MLDPGAHLVGQGQRRGHTRVDPDHAALAAEDRQTSVVALDVVLGGGQVDEVDVLVLGGDVLELDAQRPDQLSG